MRLPFISAIAVCLLGSCSLAQAQSLAQVQVQSQAQAQAQSQAQIQAQVQAQVQAQAQIQSRTQSQAPAHTQTQTHADTPSYALGASVTGRLWSKVPMATDHGQSLAPPQSSFGARGRRRHAGPVVLILYNRAGTHTPADVQGLCRARWYQPYTTGRAQLIHTHTHTHTHTHIHIHIHTHTQSVHRHLIWDRLLQQFVSETGLVNYSGIKQNISQLDQYLGQLQTNPVLDSWSRDQKLAYWINAYNAFTIKLIVDHYPVKSIRDIQNPWDKKFIRLGDQMFSLNQIENQIIRPGFKEPRIHFALVCAAVSCPKLLNQAYLPQKLDEQLDQQTRYFINESGKNKLSPNLVGLSKLFSWYGTDFTNEGTLIDFINQYSEQPISDNAKIKYLEYSWDLND